MIFFAMLAISLAGSRLVCGLSPSSSDLKPAPDIKFKDLEGNKFKLSDHRGKVVIVNFWAVWCPPCKIEIPELVTLYTQYKEQGLRIIGIAIDSGKDGKIKEKAQELGINYPVINGDDYQIRNSFGGIRAVPTTFIINPDGKIYKNYVGYRDKTVFEEDIKTLLTQ